MFPPTSLKEIEFLDRYIETVRSDAKGMDKVKKVNRYLKRVIEALPDTFPETLFGQWTTK